MLPPPLRDLAESLRKLPGIGPRQAVRCAFYIFRNGKEKDNFMRALHALDHVSSCRDCFRAIVVAPGAQTEQCALCGSRERSANLLCIVEEDADIDQFEHTKAFHGKYFVLGGRISLSHDPHTLRIEALRARVARDEAINEIVLAMSPTAEGNAAALWIKQTLNEKFPNRAFTLTRLGIGIPAGAEIEYADEETLKGALEHRA